MIWNSVIAFVITPLVSLLAIGRLSLGYVLAIGNFALFGIFLGTNSFSIPRPEALPPNLSVFSATGPWEIGAYTVVAATLATRYRFRQIHWLVGKVEHISRQNKKITAAEWTALFVAAFIVIVTAWIEHLRAMQHVTEFLGRPPLQVILVIINSVS